MTTFLLTGGGTAGHVNPLLSLADAITNKDAAAKVIALGTVEGLESRLIPARGYRLETIAKLPFPRRPSLYALTFPFRFLSAVAKVRKLIRTEKVAAVVGFGGYASAPAYLAARFEKIPLVIHEANALPGIANRIGAKFATRVAVAFKGTGLPNEVVTGMPLRREIESIIQRHNEVAARVQFGLDPESFTLLVTGGSLGAKKLNDVIESSRSLFAAAGIQVLHIVGNKSELKATSAPGYVRLEYCEQMDQAIAAADFAVSRAGASTVSEFAAVGLPALYIPYPVGNGEQKFNLKELLAVGGGELALDRDFSVEYVAQKLIPLLSNSKRVAQMANAAKSVGIADGTEQLHRLVLGVLPNRQTH
ncbi:MAG: hypothetical protein RLZZ164_127 [Actinomycetota bacterium]|jgi:UDP-N-acetylglucosamine--N-acetylmuramyl-(pentapeptide) pyrophosphoryl-undecaprenol N-acetylglucosamine transferase